MRSFGTLSLAVAAVAACGGTTSTTSPSARAFPREPTALSRTTALERIPHEASAAVVVGSLRALDRRLGREALAREHRAIYESAVAAVVAIAGHNLLDPGTMTEVGLDPDRPWGCAVIGDAVAVFAPIVDRDKLELALYRVAGAAELEVEVEALGDALVLVGAREPDVAVALVDDTAYLVIADETDAANLARRIAVLPPEASLARDGAARAAIERLGFGADLAGYAAVDPVAALLERPPEPIRFAFGADLDGESIRFELVAPELPSWLPLADAPGPQALQRAAAGHRLVALTASVDPAAAARSPLLAPFAVDIARHTGIALAADLAPIATGDVGVAVVSDLARDAVTADGFADHLDLHVAIGVADEAKARALVERFVEALPESGATRSGERWFIADALGSGLHLDVAGGTIAATTDPSLFDRLAASDAAVARSGEAAALLDEPGAALRLELDAVTLGSLLMRREYAEAGMFGALAGDPEGEQVPWSEESRALQAQLANAYGELGELEAAFERRRAKRELALQRDAGVLSVRVDRDRGGLVARGLYEPNGGAAGLVAAVADYSVESWRGSLEDERRLRAAQERAFELQQKLSEARARDRVEWDKQQRASQAPATQPTSLAVTGSLTKPAIRKVIRKRLARIRYCYESELQNDPTLAGTVVVEFVIGAKGDVISSKAGGMRHQRLESCVARAIKALTFPKPKGGGLVKVRYPFTLRPAP